MALSKAALVFWFFSGIGALYSTLLGLLTTPWLQRQALYAHKFHSAWWHDISKPESFGFAKNQVTPFNITTPDGEILFAWHILPLAVYARNQQGLLSQPTGVSFQDSLSYRLLQQDAKANLVISFHGNAGNVAEGERPSALRALASLPSTAAGSDAHILTFDYRGFGRSSGSPTESGLITDAIAVLEAARSKLGVSAQRTVLTGTSLGTGVIAGALDAITNSTQAKQDSHYAGVVLSSSFESLATLLPTYAIAGVVPILGPISAYPRITSYLIKSLVDTWTSGERWTRVCSAAATDKRQLALHVLHAHNDHDIAWQHADRVYEACLAGLDGGGQSGVQSTSEDKGSVDADLTKRLGWNSSSRGHGMSGRWTRSYASKDKTLSLRETLVEHGGHNSLVWHAPSILAVWELLDGIDRGSFA